MKSHAFIRLSGAEHRPGSLVHFCFIAVFLFSTFLTWREGLVLKNTWKVNQQIHLTNVAVALDRQFQFGLDALSFYRSMLSYALTSPIESDNTRRAIALFATQRDSPVWRLNLNTQRSMPLNGVSDRWLRDYPLLNRDDPERLKNELSAALEFSFILQFSDPEHDFQTRLWYISRGGFYVSSTPPLNDRETLESYRGMISRDYFRAMSLQQNPQRRLYWTSIYQGLLDEVPMITVIAPVDSKGYWYGVLAMDFTRDSIQKLLQRSFQQPQQGIVMLMDSQFNQLASSDRQPGRHNFSQAEVARLQAAVQRGARGELRLGSRFITWDRLRGFDGVIVNIQTLREGLHDETGRVALVLLLMWLLFSLMLLAAWYAITRLIRRMMELQTRLAWRANYDGLTRLYNRSAFFDLSSHSAALCQRNQRPLSVIQLDIDFFKMVNDNWGHHAGDVALAHVAGVIRRALRAMDIAGRVGGEEFCLLLPETSLQDAVAIAERIRQKLAQKELLIHNDQTLKLTASLGVASSEEQGEYEVESLQSLADSRLYIAKQSGRNRICWQS
ncbi:cellulose biosynthesis regulator diguanylate cyclase DgcQ [Erwiniaceae bacterium BAC15a-03b]|uniref:diguanylate cyclase n=1 Tax=Winslowiella arboricola TaxID=2978220 RepID=A0A9J6PRY1_9GAMM|nr:cellulose biosynthesis regulator diguanylate cyclase DgcQ [Winslowiella arboricola]MCU5773261.1 cellulose biosynthesis regulator diguanylate cyclase DgcQ [Winslowiella arboricola]MCU5779147.1 cellulose biosynthesis regulator diguanylate cyclase DgcQ [Winslowiella arboricola]